MSARLRSLLADTRGTSLIELLVAMAVSAIIVALMVTWAGAVVGTETQSSSDDSAVQELRVAKEELGKDIRRSEEIVTSGDKNLTMWIDLDRDGTRDLGEEISWSISTSGELLRSDDHGGLRVAVDRIVYAASGFTYDVAGPSGIENVGFRLVAEVTTGPAATGQRSIDAEINIRNS